MNWQQAIGIQQAANHSPDYKRTHAQGLIEDAALETLSQIAQEWEAMKQAEQQATAQPPGKGKNSKP